MNDLFQQFASHTLAYLVRYTYSIKLTIAEKEGQKRINIIE